MEALILRRNYPAPVTFADLRRARAMCTFKPGLCAAPAYRLPSTNIRWHVALKEATGAHDDISVVTTEGEVRIGAVVDGVPCIDSGICGRWSLSIRSTDVTNLVARARDLGYWECPHEVRFELTDARARDTVSHTITDATEAARARRSPTP